MSSNVSTFSKVKIGDYNYLFFLVARTDYLTPMREELNKQLNAFGQDLGAKGMVVSPFERASKDVANEVLNKSWGHDFKRRLVNEFDLFMLIIDVDFKVFDPQQHHWGIIYFSDYPKEQVPRILHQLAEITRNSQDIFPYLSKLANKTKTGKKAEYFNIKPGMFGVSIDINRIIKDRTKP